MAQIEEKEEVMKKNTPAKKKPVKKANTKPQEKADNNEEVKEVKEEVKEEPKQEEVKEYPEYHISEVGDNPYNLSVKYDTSISEIERLNPNTNWLNMKPKTKVRVK